MGAVTDAGRNPNHRLVNQATNDTWKCRFHAGDDNDDIRTLNLGQSAEKPVDSRNPDIKDSTDRVPHELGGDRSLLCDWQVAGTGRNHRNFPRGGLDRTGFQRQDSRDGVMSRVRKGGKERPGMIGSDPGHQNTLVSLKNATSYRDHLLRGLAGAIDDFRESLPKISVGIDGGKSELNHGCRLKSVECFAAGNFPTLEPIQ